MYQYGVGVLVPVSVCGARCAPCRRCGGVAHRPRHTKLPCCICHRQRRAAWARLSPPVRVRFQQRINPIVNVSFTMGFIGAGDRTRTGTPSLAADFESATSTISSHRQVWYFIVRFAGAGVRLRCPKFPAR